MTQVGRFFLRDTAMSYEADDKGLRIKLHDDTEPNQWLTITWFHLDRLRELVKED